MHQMTTHNNWHRESDKISKDLLLETCRTGQAGGVVGRENNWDAWKLGSFQAAPHSCSVNTDIGYIHRPSIIAQVSVFYQPVLLSAIHHRPVTKKGERSNPTLWSSIIMVGLPVGGRSEAEFSFLFRVLPGKAEGTNRSRHFLSGRPSCWVGWMEKHGDAILSIHSLFSQ